MASSKKTVLLDVDPSIMENNLLIADPDAGLDSLFPKAGPQSKVVTPIPGMCVKLRRATEDHGKVFINLCHTKEIPAPEDIDEKRLMELWNASTETCEYRVPLSIGEVRHEPDKSGQPADVYDVAVNTTFFGKVETTSIFRMFVIDVIMQGIEDKFHIELEKEDYVIMKNRKAMGTIPGHRVRVGDRAPGSEGKPAVPLVQELSTRYTATPRASTSPVTPVSAADAVKPDFRLLKEPCQGPAKAFVAQIKLPTVVSASQVTLDVGEDRLVLSGGHPTSYHLDMFLPSCVAQSFTTANFNNMDRILTVTMPVVQ